MRSVILPNVGTLILYNETHQYLEDLHNSVKHYFPNDSCAMPQEHMWVKGWFKVQEKPMALTVKIEKFIDDVADSTLTNLKKLPLWGGISTIIWKDKLFLPFSTTYVCETAFPLHTSLTKTDWM